MVYGSEKISIADVWLGTKYASVNITLDLTIFKRTYFYKVNEIF